MSAERRDSTRNPIRLKVSYRNARALVVEYTTSVSKGGCRLTCKRPLPVGTQFVFEMYARQNETPVEVLGEVVWCSPSDESGLHDVGIQYLPSPEKREALERVLDQIFSEQNYEKARLHPRVPVNLVAFDPGDQTRRYLLRDLSRGGMGLRLPLEQSLHPEIKPRGLTMLTVQFEEGQPLEIGGEVIWCVDGRRGFTHASLGVAFLGIGVEQQEAIDALSRLRRPAKLLLVFGPRGQ